MFNPKVKYDIFETKEMMEDHIHKISRVLKKRVNDGEITKPAARKHFDMLVNAYEYLCIFEKMAKDEDFLSDRSFSMEHLYSDEPTKDSLQKALEKIS